MKAKVIGAGVAVLFMAAGAEMGGKVHGQVYTKTYSDAALVMADEDISFTLPKFDTQGGIRTLVGVILRSTTTVTQGKIQVENISDFAGTMAELTLSLTAESHVFLTPPFPAIPRADINVPFVPAPEFTFGPVVLSKSLVNVPMPAGGSFSVDLTGQTTGLQEAVINQASPQLASFISAAGDTVIDFVATSKTSSTVTVETLAGNANGDDVVDAADYIILKRHMGQSTSAGASDGDFDGDSTVDRDDLQTLVSYMGRSRINVFSRIDPSISYNVSGQVIYQYVSYGHGAIPEPATLSLLALGWLAVMRRRHGRR